MKRLSYNTLILLANNLMTAILSLALTVIITRGLGDADFGRYAAVMAWVLPFTVLADGGLNTLLTRDVAQQPASAHTALRQLLPLRLVISAIIVGLVWIFAPFLSDEHVVMVAIRIGIGLAVIDAFFGSYTAIFRAWEVVWPILVLNSVFFGLQIVGVIWVLAQKGDVVALVSMIVLADAIQLGLTWFLWRWRLRHLHPSTTSTPIFWPIALRQAYPFAIAGLLAMLNMRVMILLLDRTVSAEQVGWYAVAFRLLEAARLAPNAFFVALFPRLAALATQPKAFRQIARRALLLLIGYSFVAGLATVVLSATIIPRVFGLDFQPTVGVLNVLIWVLLPSNGRALLTLQLYAYGRQQLVNGILLVGLLFQIGVGYGLVQRYGLYGAPLAVIIGEAFLMLCLGWALRRIMATH